jgi:hypothetical protein
LSWFAPWSTNAALAANSNYDLGVNAQVPFVSGSSYLQTAYTMPVTGYLTSCTIAMGQAAPGAGQSYTFTLFDGTTSLGTATISGASSFSATLTPSGTGFVTAGDPLHMEISTSSGAAASNVRTVCSFIG